MPRSAPRPCREPGCPELVNNREGFCPAHLKEDKYRNRARHRRYTEKRDQDEDEKRLSKFYRTSTWRKLRNTYLAENPLCAMCSELGRLTVGTVVDHIKERRDGGHNTDKANLQTLCTKCHTVKTNEEKRRRNRNERDNHNQ